MIFRLVLAGILTALASVASAQQPAPPAGPPPVVARDAFGEETILPARTIIFKKGTAKWEQAWPTIVETFKSLRAAADRVGAKVNGPAFLVYQSTDDEGFEFEAALPIEAAPASAPGGDIQVGPAPAGKALKFVHRGAFDAMETFYESIANLLDSKGLPADELFIEEFVTDPLTAKPDALVINVYVPVKGK